MLLSKLVISSEPFEEFRDNGTNYLSVTLSRLDTTVVFQDVTDRHLA